MSDTDSFIEEVSEEVRRDRLFKLFRRYGWIAVAVVVVLVGGAAVREWRISQAETKAEMLGDGILDALRNEDLDARVTALGAVESDGDAAAIQAFLVSALDGEADRNFDAAQKLEAIATSPDLPIRYTHLASLKRAMLLANDLGLDERLALLEPLTTPGAPYRVLAQEQMAIAEIDNGETAGAITRLQRLLDDSEASAGLRRRATDVIVALGGSPEPGQ